ncbi:MAG: hypothetical protein ACI4XA_03520 [Oscillospiraceae bacterium]
MTVSTVGLQEMLRRCLATFWIKVKLNSMAHIVVDMFIVVNLII